MINQEKSANSIWSWNFAGADEQVFNDRDSLLSEESDESDSESDWSGGADDQDIGEGKWYYFFDQILFFFSRNDLTHGRNVLYGQIFK